MSKLVIRSAAEQVAEHLRKEMMAGVWGDLSPGGQRLARELGVNHKTAEAALRQLESEGVLLSRGAGSRRRIAKQVDSVRPSLRVAILLGELGDRRVDYMVEAQHLLTEAGQTPFFPFRTLAETGMDVTRIARLVQRVEADAWVIGAGSREVLEWFAMQPVPVLALFGRPQQLAIAGVGPDKLPAFAAVAERLAGLGHRRIVLLTRRQHRRPEPSATVRAFLGTLEASGIRTGSYNLPDWDETKDGLHAILDSLFRVTPPTALFIDEAFMFAATQQFLARKGIRVPEEVSLVCTDPDPTFAWHDPSVAHIRWDSRPVVRRIVRWAVNVSNGKVDLRQTRTGAEFVDGGTVGPVNGG